ncbi:MAG: T9SS type A sorting domain-containing protein [Bacteroidetes bacterium]|nr:T9SS type A sorting domain-containing protein [Bacteroidota bacterium]
MRKFTFLAIWGMIALALNIPGYAQAPFTTGNVVVLRAGDGAASLSTLSTLLFLDEFTPAGSPVQTIAIPSTGPNRLTIVGNATTEGHITLSPDGSYLVLPGYDAGPGIASIGSSTAAENNRKLLRVDQQVNYYPILSSTAFSGTNIRSGVCSGNDYWASGSSGGAAGTNGVQYFGSGPPAQVSSTITNIRDINIFNNQLYISATIGTYGIYAVGTGLPVTGPQTATNVINTGIGFPNAFSFNSASDVCYIADDHTTGTGGIQKWAYSTGAWVLSYTISLGTSTGSKGLTVDWSGANPVIYATTIGSPTSAPNKLVKVVDVGIASTFTVLSTAGTNTQYRSVAFTPGVAVISAPTSQAHDISFTGVAETGMTAGWVNGNGTNRIVIMNTANSFTDPLNGTDPAASAAYKGQGEQVVYNGSGSSVSVTGLTGSTTCWFRVYEYNGTGATSKFLAATATLNPNSQTTLAAPVPPALVVQDVTLGSGQSNCYNATQTISIAGSGTSFIVQSGGTASMIAGQDIFFYPGTAVESGGYLHGSIAPGGPFCGGVIPSRPAVISGEEEIAGTSASTSFTIYPNPTTGIFTLEYRNDKSGGNASVEIYSMHGEKVLISAMPGEKKHSFSLSGFPPGIYFVRVVSGDLTETVKLIRQ